MIPLAPHARTLAPFHSAPVARRSPAVRFIFALAQPTRTMVTRRTALDLQAADLFTLAGNLAYSLQDSVASSPTNVNEEEEI